MTLTVDGVIRFTVPGLAPASWSGNSRAHWRKRHADGKAYQEAVWIAYGQSHEPGPYCCVVEGTPWEKARLTLTQRAIRPRDVDNFLSTTKPLIDVLRLNSPRSLGFIVDDDPSRLTIEVRTERVAHKHEEGVLVEIERAGGTEQ